MRAVGRLHARFDDRRDLRQSRRTSLLRRAPRARREALAKEIGKQCAGARLRQQLIAAQGDGHGLRARPIRHDIRDLGGKRGGLAGLTMTTGLLRGAMFGAGKPQHGQFEDLPPFVRGRGLGRQLLPTVGAMRVALRLNLIGLRLQAQGRATMPGLPADRTLTFLAQAFGLFLKTVLRGRLTAVARGAPPLPFQFRDARRQFIYALEQAGDQGDDRLGPCVSYTAWISSRVISCAAYYDLTARPVLGI